MQAVYLQSAYDGTPQQVAITRAQKCFSRVAIRVLQFPPRQLRGCRTALAARMDEMFLAGDDPEDVIPQLRWALGDLALPSELVETATAMLADEWSKP